MHSKRNLLVCGDSILDNGPYVGLLGRPLKSHLAKILHDWEIDFRAVDGAVCSDVSRRASAMRRFPSLQTLQVKLTLCARSSHSSTPRNDSHYQISDGAG
jgi:hypothetical protein